MANSYQSKVRLIAVYRILLRGRKVTSQDILRELDLRYDINCDRKTLCSDIAAIDRFTPIDIQAGRNGGYCLCDVLGRCENG